MSRSLGPELPPDLVARLDGRDLSSSATKVIQLLTVDAGGWPHAAMLSYFEVIALDSRRIRLATHSTSTSSANIRRAGRLTLLVIDARVAIYVKTSAVELRPTMQTTPWNAAFECRVEDVLTDEPDEEYEPGAYVASGVTYHSLRLSAELERSRQVVAELRDL